MKKVIIIGGGPAAMMAADVLSPHCEVMIYEKGKRIGSKFLVAGKGGFNLTNSLDGEQLVHKFTPKSFLEKALLNFGSQALRAWLNTMGIPTFVGSSGRVFPEKGIKPAEVLKRILEKLNRQGVNIHTKHEFIGFDKAFKPIVKHQQVETSIEADAYIFALGGASWSKTGSDGSWTAHFNKIGIKTLPFRASNCGVNIDWPQQLKAHHVGKPLKNIQITLGSASFKGEATLTKYGLEGNAVYPLIPVIRKALETQQNVKIAIDLKPNTDEARLLEKLGNKAIKTSSYAKAFKLSTTKLALLKAYTDKEHFLNPSLLIHKIKALPIPVNSLRPIEEAISTIGGIPLSEVNTDFSLKKHPKIFVIGEMLDWDAPTGGFLLQACFSMGKWAGEAILSR